MKLVENFNIFLPLNVCFSVKLDFGGGKFFGKTSRHFCWDDVFISLNLHLYNSFPGLLESLATLCDVEGGGWVELHPLGPPRHSHRLHQIAVGEQLGEVRISFHH